MDEIHIKKQRGRPVGYKLNEFTKDKIRQKRLGTRHSTETKNKISKALTEFFRGRESLSDSMTGEYIEFDDEIINWLYDNREEIDDSSDLIMTEKRLSCMRTLEICLGYEIEQLFGHNANPELYMLLKEELKNQGGGSESIEELNSLV